MGPSEEIKSNRKPAKAPASFCSLTFLLYVWSCHLPLQKPSDPCLPNETQVPLLGIQGLSLPFQFCVLLCFIHTEDLVPHKHALYFLDLWLYSSFCLKCSLFLPVASFQNLTHLRPSSNITFINSLFSSTGYTKGIRILELVRTWKSSGLLLRFHRWENWSQYPSKVQALCLYFSFGFSDLLWLTSEHVLSPWLIYKLLEARTISSSSSYFSEHMVHM